MHRFPPRSVLQAVLGGVCLLAVWNVLHRPDRTSPRLTDAQMLAILTTHVGVPLLQAEFDALVLLSYNLGEGTVTDHDKGFAGSSVARFLDNKAQSRPDKLYASVEEAWHHVTVEQCKTVDGKKKCVDVLEDSPGLLTRRRGETGLFNQGTCPQ